MEIYSQKELDRIEKLNKIIFSLKEIKNGLSELDLDLSNIDVEELTDDINIVEGTFHLHLAYLVNNPKNLNHEKLKK